MLSPQVLLPFIDLFGFGALELSLDVGLSRKQIAAIKRTLGIRGDRQLAQQFWVSQYEASEQTHEVGSYFVLDRDEKIRGLRVVFDLQPVGTGTEGKFIDFLSAVTKLQLAVNPSCEFTIYYSLRNWESLIRLPLPSALSSDVSPYDEIIGMRVLKRDERGEDLWDAIVQLTDSSGSFLSHMVTYSLQGEFNEELFTKAFDAGMAISASLVAPKSGEQGIDGSDS